MGEIRGENDMEAFLECVSNGIPMMTTTHTNDARMFPDRGVNMLHAGRDAGRITDALHTYVNMSVLLKLKTGPNGSIIRYVDQVCFFLRKEEQNHAVLVVEKGKLHKDRVPSAVKEQIEDELGYDMFSCSGFDGKEEAAL